MSWYIKNVETKEYLTSIKKFTFGNFDDAVIFLDPVKAYNVLKYNSYFWKGKLGIICFGLA
jgi:hypothetical protein